jgi:hypothetical protein
VEVKCRTDADENRRRQVVSALSHPELLLGSAEGTPHHIRPRRAHSANQFSLVALVERTEGRRQRSHDLDSRKAGKQSAAEVIEDVGRGAEQEVA